MKVNQGLVLRVGAGGALLAGAILAGTAFAGGGGDLSRQPV